MIAERMLNKTDCEVWKMVIFGSSKLKSTGTIKLQIIVDPWPKINLTRINDFDEVKSSSWISFSSFRKQDKIKFHDFRPRANICCGECGIAIFCWFSNKLRHNFFKFLLWIAIFGSFPNRLRYFRLQILL